MIRVVIVDDVRDDALLLCRLFRNDCKILNPLTVCTNGKDVIDLCDEFLKSETPALFFVDMVMAPVSGLDVLRYRAASPYAKQSEVVMISGLTDLRAIKEGYQLGAKTFVLKPVSKEDMVSAFNALGSAITIHKENEGYTLHWGGNVDLKSDSPDTSLLRGRKVISISE